MEALREVSAEEMSWNSCTQYGIGISVELPATDTIYDDDWWMRWDNGIALI